MSNVEKFGQYFTPSWFAELVVERYFSNLSPDSVVLDPSCGDGSMLAAVSSDIAAIGVELDPEVAELARLNTGREIITGSFTEVEIPCEISHIIGNPPFKVGTIESFLNRAHTLLPEGGQAGLILPAFFYQTAGRVVKYSRQWSIQVEMIPRNLYPGLKHPLVFSMLTKDQKRILVGLSFYAETASQKSLKAIYREFIEKSGGSAWLSVCKLALQRLGGSAALVDIYREIEGVKPTESQFWREKVRQTLRRYSDTFSGNGNGHYQLSTN